MKYLMLTTAMAFALALPAQAADDSSSTGTSQAGQSGRDDARSYQ